MLHSFLADHDELSLYAGVARGILEHATVRPPLLPLEPGADVEITNALRSAGLVGQTSARSQAA